MFVYINTAIDTFLGEVPHKKAIKSQKYRLLQILVIVLYSIYNHELITIYRHTMFSTEGFIWLMYVSI